MLLVCFTVLLVLLPCIMFKQQQESVALGNLMPRRARSPRLEPRQDPGPSRRNSSSQRCLSSTLQHRGRVPEASKAAAMWSYSGMRGWPRPALLNKIHFDCHPTPCFGSEDYWIVTLTSNNKEKQIWDMLSFVPEKDARLVHHKHTTIPRQPLFLFVVMPLWYLLI